VDVEHPELAVAGVAKPVHGADGSGDVRPRTGSYNLGAERELGLTLQHVEGIDVVGVAVQVDSLEVRPEAQLDDLELGKFGQDAVMPLTRGTRSPPPGSMTIPPIAGSMHGPACRRRVVAGSALWRGREGS
jgi:hypothetical protein